MSDPTNPPQIAVAPGPSAPSSDLPPSPTQPGPSTTRPPRRTIYFGIKRGRVPGVYTSSRLAEDQVVDYTDACLRCFSTRHAALAYVGGWDCKGRYALPKGAPYPLYEYLLVHFSTPAYLLSPSPRRRTGFQPPRPLPVNMNDFGSLSGSDAHPSLASSSDTLTHRSSASTLRPPMGSHRESWRGSMVKSPSPLRHQVNEPEVVKPWTERAQSAMGGLVATTPPASPDVQAETISGKDKGKRSSIFGFPTFSRKQSAPAGKLLSSPEITSSSDFAPPSPRPDLRTSRSNPTLPRSRYQSSPQPPPSRLNPNPAPNRQFGLWASPTSPLAGPSSPRPPQGSRISYQASRNSFQAPPPPPKAVPAFANTEAPTFSRAAMRKAGIVMPAAASSVPRRSPSTPSLSPSSSSSSISTISSTSSHGNGSRSSAQVSTPMSDFAPPRAGFMRRPSSLSLSMSPSSSAESVATITSSSPTDESESYGKSGYAPEILGIAPSKGARMSSKEGKGEKKEGVMKGFGRMFGMKKKA